MAYRETMKKKYILWDHDGVLVNTERWFFRANQRALFEEGISISEDEYMRFMQSGVSVWTLATEKGIGDARVSEGRARRNRYYQEYLLTENIEIHGVIDVLENLRRNFSMAIVTASRREDFDLIHHSRSILNYMDFCLTSGDYVKSKPFPDPYLAAVERFGASPDECVAVEDSSRGLKSAVAAGIDCVIIKHEFTQSHDFTSAFRIVDSIKDLPLLLSRC